MTITPVLLVDSIEKSLPFWIDRMGWQKIAEVPDGDRLGFVMLMRDGAAALMLQTFDSARKDEPKFHSGPESPGSSLFIKVDDWPDVVKRLDGYQITMPERETFYGMREIGVFEPSGNVVIFAIPIAK